MRVSESVSRSVRVRGSCAEWLPLARDCLSRQGYRDIAVDGERGRLTASCASGSVSVRLSPAPSCGETDVLVSATASLGGGVKVEGGSLSW